MRKIDIFLSCAQDVERERIIAERIIRSLGAEFNLPVIISSSNWLRQQPVGDPLVSDKKEHELLLNVSFWEYQDDHFKNGFREHIPNTGQFDLVVCVIGSRLGPRLAPVHVMPDGKEPTSATDYEISWVIDQVKRTPGFPALRIYRNRGISSPAFESKEQWEIFARGCQETEDFFRNEKNGVSDFHQEYLDLGEFEELFGGHLRSFLTHRLRDELMVDQPSGVFWKAIRFEVWIRFPIRTRRFSLAGPKPAKKSSKDWKSRGAEGRDWL